MRVRRPALTSRAVTRAAFAVVVLFVLAQVAWWVLFQSRYIGRVTRETVAAWNRDAESANALLSLSAGAPAVTEALEARYPHLRFDGQSFAVDPQRLRAFLRQQRGYIRMFAFEGPFFGLVILSGLAIIALSLRSERELKRRQQNFLSAVTHEFKTPLSTLRLLIETAQRRELPPEKGREYLRKMEAELGRLEHTSEQVLASARLEQGPGHPVLEEHDLNDVAANVVARARAGLEARGAVLHFLPALEPLPVSADPDALAMVLNNLLDNAVKYSPQEVKPVTVRLQAAGDVAELHVEDEGTGLPEAERARVFERFYRAGDEMTRETKGVGLGLHLVRATTEAMNGWVRVGPNREAGRGTRFTVVLPRRVAAEGSDT